MKSKALQWAELAQKEQPALMSVFHYNNNVAYVDKHGDLYVGDEWITIQDALRLGQWIVEVYKEQPDEIPKTNS